MSQLNKRAFLTGVGALAAASVAAQTSATPPATVRVVLQTALGAITVELATAAAPITAANFLRYVDAGRFDGAGFYRAVKTTDKPLTGLLQGGLASAAAKPFPSIAHESTAQTGLRHRDGTISMARYDPGTAASEFFVCVGDQPSLDADPTLPGDNAGFAAFGRIVAGMDVARAILRAPISPTAGEGTMKGQMLDPVVAITTARRG